MEKALSIQGLTVSYDNFTAIREVDVEVDQGKIVGVIGPNGAGKTTLMKAALELINRDKGKIQAYGKCIRKMRTNIAYVAQRNNIDWDCPINVLDTVIIGTYAKLGIFHRLKKTDRKWALECLKQVDMADYRNQQIGELSGGQQQFVFLARALSQEAQLFFLYEPFVGVDVSSEKTIICVLKELRNQGKTVIVVHHDISKAEEYFDDLILMNKELVEAGESKKVLEANTITKAYKSQLLFLKKENVRV